MSLARYPAYRDSGARAAGVVPAHWQTPPLYLRYSVELGKMLDTSRITGEHSRGYLRNVDVQWGSVNVDELPTMDVAPFELARYTVLPGDLLVCEGGEVGRAAVVPERARGIGYQKALHRLRPIIEGEHVSYLFYCFAWAAAQGLFSQGGSSTIDHLTGEQLRRYRFPSPPRDEQVAIARFLDREVSKIDALIAEQEKLIALLAEKRRATISHTVTRGLNARAPLKDSGVKWLGSIPAHWSVAPLMHLVQPGRPIMYGIVLPGPNVDEGIPIVKGGDVKPRRLKLDLLNRTTAEIEAPYARARLAQGDIVYSIRGTIGDAELVPHELEGANITQDVARIAPLRGVHPYWLLYVMKSGPVFVQLEQRSLGAAVRGINIHELKRARIPVPPAAEQGQMADFLDLELRKLAVLEEECGRAIGLLRERREAVIAAAVTGQIDVRAVVASVSPPRAQPIPA